MKMRMLGCGPSSGIPNIGGDWGRCDPDNPRNRRSRVSILIESDQGQHILIDTSPDLRMQLLREHIDRIDAMIWTHDHADHSHGIDELKIFYHRDKKPLPGYGRDYTIGSLQRRFSYIFKSHGGYPSICQTHILSNPDDTEIRIGLGGVELRWVDQPHGHVRSTGYRFEQAGRSIVYATDFSSISDEMVLLYAGCDLLIVDCLRDEAHPSHAHYQMAMELIVRTIPKRAILTHMDKGLDYQILKERLLSSQLPSLVEPGYDGLIIDLDG